MIDPIHLVRYVIRPVLKDLGLYSENAERLLLGTACQESECGRWLVQLGDGPALGIYQMEPATCLDIVKNFLMPRSSLYEKICKYLSDGEWLWKEGQDNAQELVGNLYYATAMCRIHYLRVPEPIPDNLPAQAVYCKK